jgi:hypothetical protein
MSIYCYLLYICIISNIFGKNVKKIISFTGSESCREEIFVSRVPAEAGDLQILGALEGELPERQKRALRLPELVRRVLPVLEIWREI